MVEFLTSSSVAPFSVALVLVCLFALVEVAGLFSGFSFLAFDGDAGLDVDGVEGSAAALLSWLGLGRAPLIIVLIAFCISFGLSGITLQSGLISAIGSPAPAWVASLVVLIPSLLTTRILSVAFARLIPQVETSVISASDLVGRVGVIVGGAARKDMPSEARVRDGHGYSHYVQVVPESDSTEFPSGTQIILVAKNGHVFVANAVETLN